MGSLTAQQNYFIAGDTSGVLYFDINPDTTLEIPGAYTYGIDIDLNGTDDFAIETNYSQSPSHTNYSIKVLPYGSNMVGYSYLAPWVTYSGDTTGYSHMGIGLGYGAIINEDRLFTDETVILIGYFDNIIGFFGHNWNPGPFIPVCLINEGSPDCIYGWIKVYNVSSSGITLDSYAVDIPATTAYVLPKLKDFNIYPNPARERLNIITEESIVDEIVIYSLTGRKVMHTRLENSTINISELQPGIYFVEVTIENTLLRQKLLVQR